MVQAPVDSDEEMFDDNNNNNTLTQSDDNNSYGLFDDSDSFDVFDCNNAMEEDGDADLLGERQLVAQGSKAITRGKAPCRTRT